MAELRSDNPNYGYRRIHALLLREQWQVSSKRVYRIWKQEGWHRPAKLELKNSAAKRKALHHSSAVANHPNHIWAWDFCPDEDLNGHRLVWFSLLDEHTRECLTLNVERKFSGAAVASALADVLSTRASPRLIRCDCEATWTEPAVRDCLAAYQIRLLRNHAGRPWENGIVESFQSKLRVEFLATEEFYDVRDAQVQGNRWRFHYNQLRPHSSLGYLTPAGFALGWKQSRETKHDS